MFKKILPITSKFIGVILCLTLLIISGGKPSSRIKAQIKPPTNLIETSLTAIPLRIGEEFTLRAKPGEKIQTSLKFRNTSPQTLLISSSAQDFVIDDNGETPIPVTIQDISNRWSLASWIVLTPSVNQVAPNESRVINVIIDIPPDALPGGHYAMVTHQPTTNPAAVNGGGDQPASAAFLRQRVGTLLYVVVEGEINEAAFIRNFHVPSFTEYGPVPFSLEVDNQSDIHVRPQLSVEIYTIFGHKLETIPIETKNIFPFMARNFSGEWDRVWGWGLYKAKVVMSYGTKGQLALAQTTFWLLPITLILTGLAVLLILLAISMLVMRRLRRHQYTSKLQTEKLQTKIKELEEHQPGQDNPQSV